MFMTCDMSDRVTRGERGAQTRQSIVLGGLERFAFQPFQLDSDGEIVAVVAPQVLRSPGVPGPVVATDELPEVALAADEKMC